MKKINWDRIYVIIFIIVVISVYYNNKLRNINHREINNTRKYYSLFLMMNNWLQAKQMNKSIEKYLNERKYGKIAIYGMGHAGKTLYRELKETSIEIVCGIDNYVLDTYDEVPIICPDGKIKDYEFDAIIVTAVTYFDDVADKLEMFVNCPIISLDNVIANLRFQV